MQETNKFSVTEFIMNELQSCNFAPMLDHHVPEKIDQYNRGYHDALAKLREILNRDKDVIKQKIIDTVVNDNIDLARAFVGEIKNIENAMKFIDYLDIEQPYENNL